MNRKQKLNRIIGLLLAVVLAAGLLPFSLLPAEAEPSYISNVIGPIGSEDEEIDFGESDPEADLESEGDFVASLHEVALKGLPYNERLLAVAETQLGYTESETNFVVKEDEETGKKAKYGITRYGQWYGLPYEDWCAMFISFCLHYGEIPNYLMPADSGAFTWVNRLQSLELFRWRNEYTPKPGDLIFFDNDLSGRSDHVGIVSSLYTEDDVEMVETIEGNHSKTVEKFSYPLISLEIQGYGVMSEEIPADEQESAVTTEYVSGADTYRVTVTYTPDALIPDNAVVIVSEIFPGTPEFDAYVAESAGALGWEEDSVTDAMVLDISLYADGVEIQPAAPVNVEMVLVDKSADDWNVVHFGQEEPRVLESTSEGDAVSFATEGFSVFVFAKSKLEKTLVASDGNTYNITLTYNADRAGIPDDAELLVTEILPGSDEYAAYMQMADESIESEMVFFARFFDITIISDGQEIQPLAPVEVSIELADELDESVKTVHFGDEVEVIEDASLSVSSGDTDVRSEVSFSADGFSVYGVLLTTLEKTIAASDGNTYSINVTFGANAKLPLDAQLDAREILPSETGEYDDYLRETESALGYDTGTIPYARFFDITILSAAGEKLQPADGTTVDVCIELADKNDSDEAAANTKVVHFADDSVAGEVVENLAVEGNIISFEAEGFSAYAIVEGPDPDVLKGSIIKTLGDLSNAVYNSESLYLSVDRGSGEQYFTNNLSGNVLKITTAKDLERAGTWILEPTGTENEYRIRTEDGSYIKQETSDSNNITYSPNEWSVFVLSQPTGDSNRFYFKLKDNNRWLQYSNGGGGIRLYTDASNAGNCAIQIMLVNPPAITSDPYELDGLFYGLMSWSGGAAGKALMASSGTANTLDAKALTVMANKNNNNDKLFVPNDSDISMWTFTWADNDNYYLTSVVDGSTKYLKIDSSGLSLVSTRDEASEIQVIPGTGIHEGEICLKAGGHTLTFSGTVDGGFSIDGSAGNEWLHLVELSELTNDYFMTYTATKVGVSDSSITNASRVIIYTRSWNEDKLRYDYYAINSDGTLIPVYESGDSIQWVGGQLNTLLWNFVEYYWEGTSDPNYYYELYNQYSDQYIAPQVSGDQILSGEPIGINLPGRQNGQYYSNIFAWDEASYSYAGLKVEDGKIVICPKSEAMDFYFAVMHDLNVDDTLHEVSTVDHTQYGVTMKMIDFGSRNVMSDFLGNDEGGATLNLQQGLLSTNLTDDGYPTAAGGSLGNLFGGAQEVNHLFLQGTYGETGYFEYDSSQNFATLKGATGGNFTVYKELGTYDSGGNKNTLKHGQFFPYNDLKAGTYASSNGKNLYSATGSQLPNTDPRKNEQLYSIEYDNIKADTYFGMELEAGFTQTPSGLDAWGHDIIFEFTGDDDFWLYVDGELVLDLGGIHSAVPGSVNFRTGDVNVNGKKTTLRAVFESNYRKRNPSASAADVASYLAQYFDEGSTVFKDDTNHTMKIFYMERGAGASNLHMRFNLASVKPGTVELSKALSGVDTTESVMAEFPYQIRYKYTGDETENLLSNKVSDAGQDYVFYKDSSKPVEYSDSLTIDGVTYSNVFILKPGETAVINFPTDNNGDPIASYSIVECGVNTAVYQSVQVNGSPLIGTTDSGTGTYLTNRKDYGTGFDTTANRPKVSYTNTVNPEALRTLTITKKLYKEDGITPISALEDDTEFSFRLYIASEFANLDIANMHAYYVKDPDGNYCTWDAEQQKFVSSETATTFHTSINGSISKIPAGYTVEVKDVLAGTQYRVEERPNEIPDGYSFQKYDNYEYKDNNNVSHAGVAERSGRSGVNGTVIAKYDPHVDICNLKGWGLRVNKNWTDADYMSSRNPTYFALYIKNGNNLELVEASVRQLAYKTNPQTIYWYYDHLPVQGTTGVGDYLIREVTISEGFTVDDSNGAVTLSAGSTVHPIGQNGEIELKGTQKGETEESEFTYTVKYSEGTTTTDSNVRVDTVTNDRPGIILRKEKWNGEALEGAEFTLRDPQRDADNNLIGTYTSGSDGIITTAFLSEGKDYTLTEIKTPQGWHGLQGNVTIQWNNGEVTASGADQSYYTVTQASGNTLATVTIKNRPYTFKAIKIDGNTKVPLEGVMFALHKQRTVGNVTSVDTEPMAGFDSLRTGTDTVAGVIPGIDNTLPAGTYELREKEKLPTYQDLAAYIRFTVSETGIISLETTDSAGRSLPYGVEISTEEGSTGDGILHYVLTIPNYRDIVIKKVDSQNETRSLPGATFSLYKNNSTNPPYTSEDLLNSKTTGEDGFLKLENLEFGDYWLTETAAPPGYVMPDSPIKISISVTGVTATWGGDPSKELTVEEPTEQNATWQIVVPNTPGMVLPETGGRGTGAYSAFGLALVLAAAGAMLLQGKKRKNGKS